MSIRCSSSCSTKCRRRACETLAPDARLAVDPAGLHHCVGHFGGIGSLGSDESHGDQLGVAPGAAGPGTAGCGAREAPAVTPTETPVTRQPGAGSMERGATDGRTRLCATAEGTSLRPCATGPEFRKPAADGRAATRPAQPGRLSPAPAQARPLQLRTLRNQPAKPLGPLVAKTLARPARRHPRLPRLRPSL
ncbi:hypothetical protein D9M71_363800 [compost metagenome]